MRRTGQRTGLHLFVVLVALLAPLLLQPSTALAQAFTVNSTLDEPDANPGDGQCASTPSGACTLRAAIMEANSQGGSNTIALPAGTFKLTRIGANEDGGSTGDLDIFANLTITGAGASSTIVDGNNADRVFDVHSGPTPLVLALSQLTVTGGSGSGVVMDGGTLSATSCTFTNNNGAIRGTGTVTVAGGTFGNTDSITGASVAVADSTLGSDISTNGNDISVTNTTITKGNIFAARDLTVTTTTVSQGTLRANRNLLMIQSTVDRGNGFPAPVVSTGGTITLRGRRVTNSTGTAGAVNAPNVVLENSTLSGNTGSLYTGGILADSVTLTGSTITGNVGPFTGALTAFTNVTMTDSTVSGNRGTTVGGIFAPRVSLTRSHVDNNTGTNPSNGFGGIQSDSNSVTPSTVTLVGSTVSGNTGALTGGIGLNGTLTLTDSTIAYNQALNGNQPSSGLGGGVNVGANGQVTVTTSTISNNSASQTGGGIFLASNGQLTITSSTISNNSAVTAGGGISLGDGATFILTNSTVSGNSAPTGGGIGQAGSAALHLVSSTIANNTAGTNGSGLYKLGGTADVRNTIIANNTGSANCFHVTPFTSVGHNIDSGASCGFSNAADKNTTDPKLGSLTNNGGPTQTMALLSSSPAIDAGNPDGCPATDQRGYARPQDGDDSPPATCDIGAFEAPPNTTPPPTTCSPRPPVGVTSTPDGSGGLRVTVATSGSGGAISSLQFGQGTNAQITTPGGPPNATGSFTVSPPAGAASFTFTVRRATGGQATQVPFTVVDACGSWPTFAGGGPSAF